MKTVQEKLIDAEKIINEVEDLRKMQKRYFATSDRELLGKCKIQEKKIDDMISNYKNPNTQQTLW